MNIEEKKDEAKQLMAEIDAEFKANAEQINQLQQRQVQLREAYLRAEGGLAALNALDLGHQEAGSAMSANA